MANTNFAALTSEQKTTWSRDLWKVARNMSFTNQFAGKGPNAMIQRITELTKNEKGARAVISLVADLTGDGTAGDDTLEGREEAITAYDQVIQIDQLRHANRHKGKMADQKSVINFRENSKDVLSYWLADRIDQMSFLTLSGLAYTNTNAGGTRVGSALAQLDFAADVSVPTSNRHFQASSGALSTTLNTATLATATDHASYKLLVNAKAQAKEMYIRGVRGEGGKEVYHIFLDPIAMARLRLDADFLANVRGAGVRGAANPLFAGSDSFMLDGMYVHEFRHVYHKASWGATTQGGCRMLVCGAQAMGMADIGAPEWNEKDFDYGNQQGIEVGKIFGLLKPKFMSAQSGQTEDFGVMVVDVSH